MFKPVLPVKEKVELYAINVPCSGEGRTKGKRRLKYPSPRGFPMEIISPLRDQGNAGRRGGSAGDLIVLIQESLMIISCAMETIFTMILH